MTCGDAVTVDTHAGVAAVSRSPGDGRRLDRVLARTRRQFEAAGISSPALDARLLLGAATGLGHERLIAEPDRLIEPGDIEHLDRLVRRRMAREPVSRILGEREFWGRSFSLAPSTLDPRADTETVVEGALECARKLATEAPTIADLGTGTGCVLISLLCELEGALGVGVDIDSAAVAVAAANARRHLPGGRATFVCGDWLEAIKGRFDMIVANPPYVRSAEIDALEPEVARFEPRRALDGGADGLDAYRHIGAAAAGHLVPGGFLVVEVGHGQGDAVSAMFARQGLLVTGRRCDLGGTSRCIFATPDGQLWGGKKRGWKSHIQGLV